MCEKKYAEKKYMVNLIDLHRTRVLRDGLGFSKISVLSANMEDLDSQNICHISYIKDLILEMENDWNPGEIGRLITDKKTGVRRVERITKTEADTAIEEKLGKVESSIEKADDDDEGIQVFKTYEEQAEEEDLCDAMYEIHEDVRAQLVVDDIEMNMVEYLDEEVEKEITIYYENRNKNQTRAENRKCLLRSKYFKACILKHTWDMFVMKDFVSSDSLGFMNTDRLTLNYENIIKDILDREYSPN